jgi:hypothetical protein
MSTPTVLVNFIVLCDDYTWTDDNHSYWIPMPDSGEEFEPGGSMVLDAATRYANENLLPTLVGAVMMIAVSDEPKEDQ